MAQWAREDPGLKNLRDDRNSKQEFEKIIERYDAPATPKAAGKLPLADLAAIGEAYAARLEKLGVVSRDDLILRAATAEVRRTLADELDVCCEDFTPKAP